MTGPDTWSRIKSIFNAAVEMPEAERDAFVRESCGGDEQLLLRVQTLITANDGRIDLENVVAGVASEMLEEESQAMATRRFGPYRIVREIGAGGMGTVFLGERADDEFEKKVAIKIVRGGIVGAAGRARFETERQILATLEHPGIARLLDGGTTEDGVPFVVMEYVDGQPLTEYARTNNLGMAARLNLFLDVCAAVQYAHNALVIHLDIKPGNILVPIDGQPRLLDFGIAKLLEDDAPRAITRVPQALTPEYASPEQIRGEKVGTGTDVYALGVLLYELLSGTRPFDLAGESAATIEKVITSREPAPPSRVSPTRRQIHQDLDCIVLMALNKDVSRRYRSVASLSDDVSAHLSGMPVTARPNSLPYRVGKFVSRNRLAVGAAAAMLLITIGFGFRLSAERDAAQIEAARAREVTSFVTGLFEFADPSRSRGGDITARELLDTGLARLRTELVDQPEIRSSLYSVVGYIYSTLGLDVEAEPVLREALAVATDTHGTESVEAMSVRAVLDGVLWRRGKTDEAVAMSEQNVAFHRAEASSDPLPLLEALRGLGIIRRNAGESEQAVVIAEEMLELAEGLEGLARDSAIADALGIRGLANQDLGHYDAAIADLSRALEIDLGNTTSDARTLLLAKNNLATAYIKSGKHREAGRLLRDIADTEARTLGPKHRDVGITLHNLSVVLKQQGDYAEAERTQMQALDIHLEASGEQAPIVAVAYNNLANLREDQGDPTGAIEWHLKALALSVANFGEESEQASLTYYNLGGAYSAAGDFTNAERHQRRALAIDRVVLGPEHPYIVQDLRGLGVALQDLNRREEGDGLVREALELAERVLSADDPELARSRSKLAQLELHNGRAMQAAALLRDTLRALLINFDEDHWEIGLNESLLGSALWEAADREEAAELLKSGYAKVSDGRGATHPMSVSALERLERAGLEP